MRYLALCLMLLAVGLFAVGCGEAEKKPAEKPAVEKGTETPAGGTEEPAGGTEEPAGGTEEPATPAAGD